MKLSFGMIFSIILIVIFIAFAFYAIQKFLGIQNTVKVGQFVDNLQSDVDKAWRSSQYSQKVEYFLPTKVEEICFTDNSELFFKPLGSGGIFDYREIEHLDIEKITENENPFCIKTIKGKVEMTIKRDYGEALVTITE